MSEPGNARPIARRGFLSSAIALSGVAAAGMLRPSPAAAAHRLKSLDPVNPDIYYGTTGAYFGGWPNGALKMSDNMAMMLAEVKH